MPLFEIRIMIINNKFWQQLGSNHLLRPVITVLLNKWHLSLLSYTALLSTQTFYDNFALKRLKKFPQFILPHKHCGIFHFWLSTVTRLSDMFLANTFLAQNMCLSVHCIVGHLSHIGNSLLCQVRYFPQSKSQSCIKGLLMV